MTNEERRRILQLVADGKVTTEEATELLDAIQTESQRDAPEAPAPNEFAFQRPPGPAQPTPPRSVRSANLVIQISDGSSNKVNLRIPLGLARAAGKFVPRRAQQQMKEYGIDLEELLKDLSGSERGTLLQVENDNDRVLIAVE